MEIIGKLLQKLPLQSGIGRTGNSWQKQALTPIPYFLIPKTISKNNKPQ